MELICIGCHAQLAPGKQADWCPACGSALIERAPNPDINSSLAPSLNPRPDSNSDQNANRSTAIGSPANLASEVDHRGILLPRRHALGGIITPQ